MKKIVLLTFLILMGVTTICILKINEYNNLNSNEKIESKISDIEKQINEVNSSINDKNEEKDKLKNSDNEKMELLEVWQKNLKSLKEHL